MRQELFSPLSRRSRTDATGARLQLAAVLLFDRSFDGRTHTSRVRAAVKASNSYVRSVVSLCQVPRPKCLRPVSLHCHVAREGKSN